MKHIIYSDLNERGSTAISQNSYEEAARKVDNLSIGVRDLRKEKLDKDAELQLKKNEKLEFQKWIIQNHKTSFDRQKVAQKFEKLK